MRYGSVEAGGTKMVLAVSDEQLNITERLSIPTLTPEETMPAILDFFKKNPADVIGLASFGPLDLDPASPSFGSITATPKLPWRQYPFKKAVEDALQVPCAVDTDVNAAALCEGRLGAARGTENCVYVTIGTGIGGGVYCEGHLVHGGMHPEIGHMPLQVYADDPMPGGICPYHGACLEGLASGPSIERRWGLSARKLPDDHPVWDLEARYLAQMCTTLMMILSPERIVLGGGVMHKELLFPLVRKKTAEMIAGYLTSHNAVELDKTIVPPACFPDSGLIGGLLLAKDMVQNK